MIHPDSVRQWEAESNDLRAIIGSQRREIERLRECLKDCVAIIRGETSDPGWAALKTADDLIAASVSEKE